jgi:hypothetical protein
MAQGPTRIEVAGLTDEEARLFSVWQERCHSIAEKEGRRLDIRKDGLPVLAIVLGEEGAGLSNQEVVNIGMKFAGALLQALKLVRETGGSA